MAKDVQFKVCGLTSVADARAAADAGATFLGFNFYEKSPRYIPLDAYRAMRPNLPHAAKVAVVVNPDAASLDALDVEGFDFFQIHFPGRDFEAAKLWSERIGPPRLWLAPKIAPGEAFDARLLGLAATILLDGYKADVYGGTGRLSDWDRFAALSSRHAQTRWILAGGLSPENAAEAARATGARVLDFNSGVETSPGKKDQMRLQAVREALDAL